MEYRKLDKLGIEVSLLGFGCMRFPLLENGTIDEKEAEMLINNGCKYIIEGANMPTTAKGVHYFSEHGGIIAPAKAANAGGVAVSALEMSQNSMRYSWSKEEVDEKLKDIMKNIHKAACDASMRYNLGYDLIKGANIAGFEKVVLAMMSQGIY